MSSTVRVLGVGALVFSTSCMSTRQETRQQKVQVITNPPGATVTRQDATGTLAVGTSPIDVEYNYDVEVRDWNHVGCWSSAVVGYGGGAAGGLVLASGIKNCCHESDTAERDLVVGGVGLGLGIALAATMTAICLAAP